MATIQDFLSKLPFASTPEIYQGLLKPEQAAALERRANIGGLLGFAGALAQGMSPQGYRRSALQNILTAAGAGFGGAGQTYAPTPASFCLFSMKANWVFQMAT